MLQELDNAEHPIAMQVGFAHWLPVCFGIFDFECGLEFHGNSRSGAAQRPLTIIRRGAID
jgi:hypothetical protein